MTIGNECTLQLQQVMQQKGMSQRQLSKKSGVSRAYICELQNGTYKNPGILVISRLCIGLNCSFSDLIKINYDMDIIDFANNT